MDGRALGGDHGGPLALDPVQHFGSDLDFTVDFPCVRLVAHHCLGHFLDVTSTC
jgi:hypothetical protein